MKKALSIALALTLLFSIVPCALAASTEATQAANELHALGLFKGVGSNSDGTPNFDLDRAPTRFEAVTMLVRLLGKENEALKGTWTTPFTDVVKWAEPYVGYAYANGLTSGMGGGAYGGDLTVTATQYITFVLRALGYESGTDFQWDKAWELSDKIGLTDGRYNADTAAFLRGDTAIISNNALSVTLKGESKTLRDIILNGTPSTPQPPTDGDRIVFAGTLNSYTYDQVLALQGESDPNPGYNVERNKTFWLIVLDKPQAMSLNSHSDPGWMTERTVSIVAVSGVEQYKGQHLYFSIDPKTTWWPSDTSLPLGQPSADNVHVLGQA